MSEDLKISVTKLIADGSNWVTYHDRLMWAIDSHNLSDHLTNLSVTQTYLDKGDVNGVMPQNRWRKDQAVHLVIGSGNPRVFSE